MSPDCAVTVVRLPTVITVAPAPASVTLTAPGPQGPPGVTSVGQVRVTLPAAVALSGHRAVTRQPDGTLDYASNTLAAHVHAPIWLTTGAAAAGVLVEVLLYGQLTEPSWSWTPGPLYLGTGGLITQTPPSAPGALFLVQLGVATGPTAVVLDRQPSITLI